MQSPVDESQNELENKSKNAKMKGAKQIHTPHALTHTNIANEKLKLRLDILLISSRLLYIQPKTNTYFMYFSCIIHMAELEIRTPPTIFRTNLSSLIMN